MGSNVDALLHLMQPEVRDGILYKCFCAEFGVRDLTTDELWELFDVRWAALSEVRFDKGLEAFLMRDDADGEPSTIQLAALDPAGHVIGGLRIHITPLRLLGKMNAVQISRVGVAWIARGAGIGGILVSKSLRIAKALGVVKSLPLVFLLGRVLDTQDPNRVLSFYERIGFRRTNLFTVTKGLSNCLMLAGVQQSSLQYLRSQGFQVEEAQEHGALYSTLLIATSVARQIQSAGRPHMEGEEGEAQTRGLLMQGSHVVIRPFLYTDLPMLHQWEHNPEPPHYASFSHMRSPTMAELEAEFKRETGSGEKHRFAINTNEGRLIGYIAYYDLRPDTRNVSLEVMIGEVDFWDGEWGKESLTLVIDYLFSRMGVHRISIAVSQLQHRLLQDLAALRFHHDGVLRDNELVGGQYINHDLWSILENE